MIKSEVGVRNVFHSKVFHGQSDTNHLKSLLVYYVRFGVNLCLEVSSISNMQLGNSCSCLEPETSIPWPLQNFSKSLQMLLVIFLCQQDIIQENGHMRDTLHQSFLGPLKNGWTKRYSQR